MTLVREITLRASLSNSEIGLLLPCNVTVDGGDSEVVVAAVDPIQMLGALGNDPLLRQVATEVKEKLQRVIAVIR